MAFSVEQICKARERIAPYIVQTPLLRLQNLDEALGCQVYVKAECMQVTGAFKLRGAMNKMLTLTKEQLACGVVAASSGNHGRAVAYAAKLLGSKASIVMPRTAPPVKINAIKALGAEVVLCETSERFQIAERVQKESGAAMVPPFNDEEIMAGQGTAGLEILEQLPQADKIIVPVSGGGLLSGIAAAVKSSRPEIQVCGAEPAMLPRYTVSLAAGEPKTVEQKASVADALVSQTPGTLCFPVVSKYADQIADVEEAFILKAMKLLLTEGKLLGEPSACIGIGAVLQGAIAVKPEEKVCFVVSGGSVGLEQLHVWLSP